MKQYLNLKNFIFLLVSLWIVFPIFQIIFALDYEFTYSVMIFIGSIGFLLFLLFLFKQIKYSDEEKKSSSFFVPIIFFLIFLIWTLICCFQAKNIEKAFLGDNYRKEGYFTYLLYAGFLGVSFLNFKISESRKTNINTSIFGRNFIYFSAVDSCFCFHDCCKLSCRLELATS